MPTAKLIPNRYPPNNVRARRKARRMKRNELAHALNVDPNYIWRWETGRCMPSWRNLYRLAALLASTPMDLFPALTTGLTEGEPHAS